MRPEYLILPLLLLMALSSCQTTADDIENPSPVESGNITTEVQAETIQAEEPAQEAQTTDTVIESVTVEESPDEITVEEEPIPKLISDLKEKDRRGGLKKQSEPEITDMPEIISPSSTLEAPEELDPEEEAQETIAPPVSEEPIPSDEPIEYFEADPLPSETAEPDRDLLPSENESAPFNPLLPILIQPHQSDSESPVPTMPEKIPQNNIPADTEQPSALDVEEIDQELPSENQNENDTILPIASGEYQLSSDSSGKLIIQLQGPGWIYLSNNGDSSFKLIDKSYDPESGRTKFIFSTSQEEDLINEIIFLKQDLLRGESAQQSLTIDSSNNPLINDQNITETPEGSQNSLETIISNSDEKPLTEDQEREEQQWQDSLYPELGTIDETMSEETISSENTARENSTVQEEPFPPTGLKASELLKQAEYYEQPGPGQSLEKAMQLYDIIIKDYPVTEERFIAESRIRYLNKHYFKVQ
ncbi:hypothetical protein EXM22_05820 [Oceanispirochaeta crateris]|uniref:Outer membrane protein assembly factor BamD n=1 Tax=Oceanispirochaeta crateris TaxID=2518645 RepID=A0A5C1QK20_9SPIO|nr:hypothetical protein [Oceanispirochaeta crateris]QEN07529.1 hypothetical protein EXM22_05820 [Oceanispirochaeta crateris]